MSFFKVLWELLPFRFLIRSSSYWRLLIIHNMYQAHSFLVASAFSPPSTYILVHFYSQSLFHHPLQVFFNAICCLRSSVNTLFKISLPQTLNLHSQLDQFFSIACTTINQNFTFLSICLPSSECKCLEDRGLRALFNAISPRRMTYHLLNERMSQVC